MAVGSEIQTVPNHPLAEVFGFPVDNLSPDAIRHRENRLCPFNNQLPNCTKSSAENPLGVCSVFNSKGQATITCPVRFRQDWRIATDAAKFFFPSGTKWTSLTEVRLNDKANKSAGNIDVVLLAYDSVGRIIDYGALEVQAVYISGNVRTPFEHYMERPRERFDMDWRKQKNYPRPDYLSSSRKRLAPQLIFKGGILHSWNRKMAVALDKPFYQTLPQLETVSKEQAEMAWFVYDLLHDPTQNRYDLVLQETIYTRFEAALLQITRSEAGSESTFLSQLQTRLDKRLSGSGNAAPDPDDAEANANA